MTYMDRLKKQIEDSEKLLFYFQKRKEEDKIRILNQKIMIKMQNLEVLSNQFNRVPTIYENTKLSNLNFNVSAFIHYVYSEELPYRENINIHRKFGHELEFAGASFQEVENRLSYLKKNHVISEKYKLVEDFTVSKKDESGILKGGEICTPPLEDTKSAWSEIQIICENLKELGAFIDRNCGGHIHINIEKETPLSLLYFLKAFAIFEPVLFLFFLGDFREVRPELWKRKTLMEQMNSANISSFGDFETFRTFLHNDFVRIKNQGKTLEMRYPNSSLNAFVIQNNVNILGKMMDKIEKDPSLYALIDQKFYEMQEIPSRNYTEIDLNLAFLFCDCFLENNIDKFYFLKQYLFCEKKVRDDYIVYNHRHKEKMMVK